MLARHHGLKEIPPRVALVKPPNGSGDKKELENSARSAFLQQFRLDQWYTRE
jgi:hypothetical protein